MIKNLRKRFIRIAMISVCTVVVLLGLIINIANFVSVNSGLTQMLEYIYDNQGTIPHDKPEGGPGQGPDKRFGGETPYSTRYFVLRYKNDGTLTQTDLKNIASVTEADTEKYLKIAVKHGDGFGYTHGYKFYAAGTGEDRRMAIFLDCSREMHAVFTIAVLTLVSVIICIILVYAVVVVFSRRAVDPVIKASECQKQFITDAGHELKTPITVIAACLKLAEMETGKQKWIDKAQAQTEKLKELVNSLVTLSRMDEENTPLKFAEFNISEAAAETAESFRDFAESEGHGLTVSVSPDIKYCGDEYAVRQLISILLDNAVKYAEKDTEIKFSLERNKKGVVIHTVNECGTIDKEELPRLFDRFYRADKSRNASTGGFGIGLSIARSIAEGHKGFVSAEAEDGHTVKFTVQLR